MISTLYFLNSRGETIIFRHYRDDVSRTAAEAFRFEAISHKETGTPIRIIGNTLFCSIKVNNVYVVATTKRNVNAAMVMAFLYKTVEVLKSYFGGKFDEDSVRNNFILIYELLDEILDFGIPQICDEKALKEFILQKGEVTEEIKKGNAGALTNHITGAVTWRREGIKYRKNEVFIDVVESVNLLVSAKGTVLRADVAGQILVKCYLSGMPECRFGMNDKISIDKGDGKSSKKKSGSGIEIDDVKFHQCVRLSQFDQERTITFIPPDGEYELMSYRITDNINYPFKVIPIVKELGRTRLEVNVKVKAQYNAKLFALNTIIKVPCPKNTARATNVVSAGKAKYEAEHDAIVWKIRKFPGDAEVTLSSEIELVASATGNKPWSRPPISMEFQVPMFTASGLHVRFLKVIEKRLNYQTIKWVRYITKAGSYQLRINA
eukprot:tig00021168_g19079.t1